MSRAVASEWNGQGAVPGLWECHARVTMVDHSDQGENALALVYSCWHSEYQETDPSVVLSCDQAPFGLSAKFSPQCARALAKALLESADVVEQHREWVAFERAQKREAHALATSPVEE
jgi:hypothetical protein